MRASDNARTSSRQNSCLVVMKMTIASQTPSVATVMIFDFVVSSEFLDRANARISVRKAWDDFVRVLIRLLGNLTNKSSGIRDGSFGTRGESFIWADYILPGFGFFFSR